MNDLTATGHTFRVVDPPALYFGTPVVLVSTLNEDDSVNLAPMSSAWWLGTSAMLGFAPGSQTNLNLRRAGECVLNLPSSDQVDAVDGLAPYTAASRIPRHKLARGYTTRRDKFEAGGLHPLASELVTPPRVAECPVQLEARVRREHPFGLWGDDVVAFEVEIVRVHVAEHLMVDGSDRYIDPERWDPLIMKFCQFYGRGRNVRESWLGDAWSMPRIGATSR